MGHCPLIRTVAGIAFFCLISADQPYIPIMQPIKITLLAFLLLGVSCLCLVSAAGKNPKKLRHVVAFKFKPQVSAQQMQQATQDFLALQQKVPQILALEGGPDLAYQKKSGKFSHCFIVTVQDEQHLAAYGVHPDHKAFSKSVDPLLDEVMVVDYWTE
jgi:Stress responsive A/B Barrel Domain